MSKKFKITLIVAIIVIAITAIFICGEIGSATEIYEQPKTTLYALDGRTIEVYAFEVDAYLKVDWYTEPVTIVYSADQRTLIIYQKEKADYLQVGWYEYPVMYVYNKLNNPILICQYEKDVYLQKGYTLEPQSVNYNDMILIARVIHAEATQNPNLRLTDRRYVGAVIMNRVRHPKFPNTVRGVIYAPKQYACVGNRWFNQDPPQECLDIARQVLLGETFGVPSNVVFQAQFPQGRGLWKKVGVHYYCYI